GGFGDPLERDPLLVAADVAEGYVTAVAAEAAYGVVLRPDGPDPDATRARRETLRRRRQRVRLIAAPGLDGPRGRAIRLDAATAGALGVGGPRSRFAIDFGASSLIALAQQGIDPNSIDAIVLTHLHGDHCAGVPFLLIDAMLASKRSRPLTIAGPRDLPRRMADIREAL